MAPAELQATLIHLLRVCQQKDDELFFRYSKINERKIELVHIQPGKPTQNAHVESFHGRLREECLRVSWFQNLFDARRKIAFWRH